MVKIRKAGQRRQIELVTVNHQDVTTIIIINIIINIKSSISKSHHGEDKKGLCAKEAK